MRSLHFIAFGFYAAVAVLITYPLITVMNTDLFGGFLTDALQTARHVWWIKHALQTGQPIFFQPTFNYPDGLPGAWLWSSGLEYFPGWLYAFVLPLNVSVNLMMLTHITLNGWSMYFLARKLFKGAFAPALLAGLVFMAYPAMQGRIYGGHAGVLALFPVPLYLYAVFRLRESNARRWYVMAAVFCALGVTGNSTLLVYYVLPVAGLVLLHTFFASIPFTPDAEDKPERAQYIAPLQTQPDVVEQMDNQPHPVVPPQSFGEGRSTRRLAFLPFPIAMGKGLGLGVKQVYQQDRLASGGTKTWFFRTLIATLAGGLLSLIFLLPLALETLNTPTYNTDVGGIVTYSADLLAVVTPSFLHPLFGRLDYTGRVLGTNLLEGTGYIGIAAALLCLFALWKQRESRWLFWLALLAWIFSLGPLLKVYDQPLMIETDGFASYVPMPWALLQNLPIISISRTPGRFNLTVGLAVALMAGYGAAYLWGRLRLLRWRWGVMVLLGMFILYEYQMFWGMHTLPTPVPEGVLALRERDDIRAVYNLPAFHFLMSKHGLYMQAYHQQNILDGKYVRDTPVNNAKLRLLQATLDPALLDAAGADVVLWFKEGGTEGERLDALTRVQLGAPIYEDDNLAVFNVPDVSPAAFTAWIEPLRIIPAWIEGGLILTSRHNSYMYAPAAGWVNFSGGVLGNSERVNLYLDDEILYTFTAEAQTSFNIPIPVTEAGFYTVRLMLDPACPEFKHPALACRQITLTDPAFGEFIPDTTENSVRDVQFANGLILEWALLGQDISAGQMLPLRLWWHFDQLPTDADSRFVHVVNEQNELVAQNDGPIAIQQADSSWAEMPEVLLPADLAPGVYRVYTGWYRYPDFERFEIFSDVPEAENRVVLLGTFEIE